MRTSAVFTCDPRRIERFASFRDEFVREGAVFIPEALPAGEVQLLQQAYQWKLDEVGDRVMRFYDGRMLQALGGHGTTEIFQRALRETAIGDIAAALFGGGPVWFLEEQIFYKEGLPGEGARRTAWHQDGSYQPFDGSKNLVMWMAFDTLFKEEGLEVIRRSHKGMLYNGVVNDPDDDSKPAFSEDLLPRVPDIEGDRSRWDIASWAHTPGDVLVFHARTLHGGGPCLPGRRRRSMALRFFGDDVVRIEHPVDRVGGTGLAQRRGGSDARTTTKDGTYLSEFSRLAIGDRISLAMDWSVRPWSPASSAPG